MQGAGPGGEDLRTLDTPASAQLAAKRIPLGVAETHAASPMLLPVRGSEAVLAVDDVAGDRPGWVQRVDAGAEQPGHRGTLESSEHVVAAFAGIDGATRLVTSHGAKLCLSLLDHRGLAPRACSAMTGHAIVELEGALVVLRTDAPPPPEEEPPTSTDRSRAPLRVATAPPPKPKPKLERGRGKKPKKPSRTPTRDEAVRKMMSSGRELAVYAERLEPEAAIPEEPSDTGLRFVEPMSGLGLIGASRRNEQIELVFYEASSGKSWRAPPGYEGKRPENYGRFGLAKLDRELAYDEGSRKGWGESPLEIGFLAEHVEPRLVELEGGSVLLGLRSFRGKCDATVVSPFVMPMLPEASACSLEPARFLLEARARHAGKPVEQLAPPTLDAAHARRAPWQPSWDVGRSVTVGARSFAMVGDALHVWRHGEAAVAQPAPLAGQRLRIRWGSIDSSGEALASTDRGLVAIASTGELRRLGVDAPFLTGPDRDDASGALGSVGARIGTGWWLGRGELRPADSAHFGTKPEARVARAVDTVALVGGDDTGIFVSLEGGALHAWSVDAEARRTLLDELAPSAIGPGFEAVRRAEGGAIIAGPARRGSGELVTLAIDHAGQMGRPSFTARRAPELGRLRLAVTPNGAIAFDAEHERATWIDARGVVVADARFPDGRSDARCLDGEPAPRFVPSPEPGRFIEVLELARPGTCTVGAFGWSADGTFSWFLSQNDGPDARAELLRVPGLWRATPRSEPGDDESPDGARKVQNRAAPVCPPDMVSIAGRYCIDRFEGTLADLGSGKLLSPDYPPTPNALAGVLADWSTRRERGGDLHARALPLPGLDPWQAGLAPRPLALSRGGVRPSAFVSGLVAREACTAAGKRLCSHEEWRTACRGQKPVRFPYGDDYVDGACNVNQPHHPAAILHGHASIGHLDPRLVRVEVDGKPLLRLTGGSPRCLSRWGDDAVHDMVGNVDEWVDQKGGAFAGGFFARGTRSGCDALVDAHPEPYLDYTTGLRCCRDAAPSAPPR